MVWQNKILFKGKDLWWGCVSYKVCLEVVGLLVARVEVNTISFLKWINKVSKF
jgi:hypothetical protein